MALVALEGLSIGDAFGGFFEFAASFSPRAEARILPKSIWHYTDDTNMTLSIFAILALYGEIVQDQLAKSLAEQYDRSRGYGLNSRAVLARIKKGYHWSEAVGKGSYGNGGAVRAGIIGAYFVDESDIDQSMQVIMEQARRSVVITHSHPESVAGAIALAVAVAWACLLHDTTPTREQFLEAILQYVPESQVRTGIISARNLSSDKTLLEVISELGNGSHLSAQDTVPLALWCASEYIGDFEKALWEAARAGGDVDTMCAMIGGIIAAFTGINGIPQDWIQHREPLPNWVYDLCSNSGFPS